MKLKVSRRVQAGVGLALLAAILIGVSLAPNLRAQAGGASPTVLNRIANKNDRAAMEAAARMRADSRTAAETADRLRAAEERGRIAADRSLAAFDNSEAGRADVPATVSQ